MLFSHKRAHCSVIVLTCFPVWITNAFGFLLYSFRILFHFKSWGPKPLSEVTAVGPNKGPGKLSFCQNVLL